MAFLKMMLKPDGGLVISVPGQENILLKYLGKGPGAAVRFEVQGPEEEIERLRLANQVNGEMAELGVEPEPAPQRQPPRPVLSLARKKAE